MPDGSLALVFPMGDEKLPGIAVEDIGRVAYAVFQAGDRTVGETVGIAGGHLSGQEMADALSRALGREIHYADVPPDVYRGFGFPGADDLGNMFQIYQEFSEDVVGARDVEEARALNPELQTFEAWLAQNKERIPIEPEESEA